MKEKSRWEEVEGIRNFNIDIMNKRHWSKKLIRKVFGVKFVNYFNYIRCLKELKRQASLQNKSHEQLQKCNSLAIVFIGTNKYKQILIHRIFVKKPF